MDTFHDKFLIESSKLNLFISFDINRDCYLAWIKIHGKIDTSIDC